MSHVLLEAGAAHANTIQQYQHFKHVMAEPSVLPLRSDMQFAAGKREAILESWEEGIRTKKALDSDLENTLKSALETFSKTFA